MKLAVAQIRPVKGNLAQNLLIHQHFIEMAVSVGAQAVFFPELSLTGYEPSLADKLAIEVNDPVLDPLQQISDTRQIVIGAGMPTRHLNEIRISMLLFQPGRTRQAYSKQLLHEDELPYFSPGNQQVYWSFSPHKIAPAICYESLQPHHVAHAAADGATIYVASVAKPAGGVSQAMTHYPHIAQKHQMTILMSNCVGPCDDFVSVGQSAVWRNDGKLLGQLGREEEGLMMVDLKTMLVEQIDIRR